MRIAIVTDAWTPQVNGVVRTLQATIAGLERRGYTVDLIEPSRFWGIRSRRVAGMKVALPPYGLSRILAAADIVHIATEGSLGLAAKWVCERKGYAYTTAFHTNFPSYVRANFGLPESLTYRYFRWFHRKAHAVLVPTPSMIAALGDNGFTNCALWGRGVDTRVFNRQPHPGAPGLDEQVEGPRPFFLNVGRVSREKNLDAFLSLTLPGTKVVIGHGPDFDRLKAAYPDVVFLGQRSGADLAACYQGADVFVFPSRFDTFGLVNVEAIACGTPVAAYPVTGPIDIVRNGRTGHLSDDLGEACLACLDLGEVEDDFSWERATDEFESHLVRKETAR